jgi:tetratricopeptide (TPR) repeat protein
MPSEYYLKRLTPINVMWVFIKLLYLHTAYVLVGLTEEAFHIAKGNYLMDLHWFHRAILNYQKALRETQNPRVHLALAFCFTRVGKPQDSVEHYRIAYEKLKQLDVALMLAIAEYETGDLNRCRELVRQLEGHEHELYLNNNAAFRKLKTKLNEKDKVQA